MGLFETLSAWIEDSHAALYQWSPYQCANCGCQFETPDVACPECGGEIERDDTPVAVDGYWGSM